MYMECPKCGQKVDFKNQVGYLFDYETGESEFDPEHGVMFHTIKCNNKDCKAYWILTLSEVYV